MGIRTIADLHHSRFGYDAMQMSQLQFDPSAPLVLGGDLGGTKTLLALAEAAGDGLRIVAERRYASRDHADFAALLADFLDGRPAVRAACFGLAGPTDGASARLTYLPWTLDADGLARRFGLGRVRLVNDFAAAAHGLAGLSDAQAPLLQAGRPEAGAPRIVVGPGTGLGVAGLLPEAGGWRVVPGEGGHMGFAPQDETQAALWHHLYAQHGRVTAEDVVSGPGLARIFAFLHGRPRNPEEIGSAALAGDADALAAWRLWSAACGAFAGDLALHWLARGGVWLAGGIAAKLMPALGAVEFLAAFNAKREHRALAEAMPVRLVVEERLGLLGALALAAAQAG